MQLTGSYLDYFISFFAGVLVSFTPCIYPVLPLTAGYIAGFNTNGSRFSGFFISLIYVFGIALTYCSLAVFAALTGQIFGQIQNHPAVYIVVSLFLLLSSFILFDIVKLPVFQIISRKNIKKKNLWTVLMFGVVAGLIVGPCTSPILGTLLLYAASKQNIFHAVSLMFVFSYGVGFSLILVGTFSGLLENLPKSGKWMIGIKRFCGTILLLLAIRIGVSALFLLK